MVDTDTAVAVQLLYGRQSHLIDSGRAAEWAATFTADGVFDSPSYPAPEVGTAALTAFAQRFFDAAVQAQERRRHVITNVSVETVATDEVMVECYLQILATPRGGDTRLVRFTAVRDRVIREGDCWRIRHRSIARDDA
ncbi:nuclear transport factor 2 family protein [Rhodococcus fascians]|nr:nuclear transport factor 2 family protein [Rhodococcus fascians]MBY4237898.1 nuclear transport factor 2 family protein [Rhodococcus fascians]MBY4253351.1 nuclear transport factor 2 family protein [Rhodococcus fascians]MBY4268988.1 nuclear transport factor 2 family protein [Rhodococcus fascians]MBY4275041.1 nuclear transport factor 2 family protein [Rhodococcus fascians]